MFSIVWTGGPMDMLRSEKGRDMGCACGKSSGEPAETYVVRTATGQTKEFNSKVAADIELTKSGGTITVQKKR